MPFHPPRGTGCGYYVVARGIHACNVCDLVLSTAHRRIARVLR